MYAHIIEHDARGHHVRRSLLHHAKTGEEAELTEEWQKARSGDLALAVEKVGERMREQWNRESPLVGMLRVLAEDAEQ